MPNRGHHLGFPALDQVRGNLRRGPAKEGRTIHPFRARAEAGTPNREPQSILEEKFGFNSSARTGEQSHDYPSLCGAYQKRQRRHPWKDSAPYSAPRSSRNNQALHGQTGERWPRWRLSPRLAPATRCSVPSIGLGPAEQLSKATHGIIATLSVTLDKKAAGPLP